MTEPVRDREQAIETVMSLRLDLDLVGEGWAIDGEGLSRDAAERIVDALLGQPDPEVERLRAQIAELETELYGPEGIRAGQVGHLNDAVRIQAERAERAEERLRAVTEAAQEVVDRWGDVDHPYLLRPAVDALRAVLSEQEGQDG